MEAATRAAVQTVALKSSLVRLKTGEENLESGPFADRDR